MWFSTLSDEILLNCIYSRAERFWERTMKILIQFAQRSLCFSFTIGSVMVLNMGLLKSIFRERGLEQLQCSYVCIVIIVSKAPLSHRKVKFFQLHPVSVVRKSGSLELQRRQTGPYVPQMTSYKRISKETISWPFFPLLFLVLQPVIHTAHCLVH